LLVTTRSAGRERRATVPYRLVVRGDVRSRLVGSLEELVVQAVADETVLQVDIVDQSHLQAVISSLSDRGIEIISLQVDSADGGPGVPAPGPDRGEGWPI
jgi:hypothetical protein